MHTPILPYPVTILHIPVNPHQRTEDAMAQATDTHPDLTFEDISDEYSKFKADVWPTDIEGVNLLKLDVERPFRDTDELSAWLHAYVAKLGTDLKNKIVDQDD